MNENINQETTDSVTTETKEIICNICHTKNPSTFYFCPNCGRELQKKPLSTSIFKQLGIYLLSIALPPLGLWPGIKYLRGKTTAEKLIGTTAIILTLIVSVVTIWYTMILISDFQSILNMQLQGSGFQNSLNQQLKERIEGQYDFK